MKKVGDKVHYIPFPGCSLTECENGIVKEFIDHKMIRVVYHCDNDWRNYQKYTGACTYTKDLGEGWIGASTLIKLLKYCTDDQINIFKRMYGHVHIYMLGFKHAYLDNIIHDMDKDKILKAIIQVENTIEKNKK